MRAARLGGLLYLAARCGGGGGQVALSLAEVAAACAPACGGTCDMFSLAQYARHQACFLRLTPLPAVDVERYVGRMARALLAAAGGGGGGGGGCLPPLPGDGGGGSGSGAPTGAAAGGAAGGRGPGQLLPAAAPTPLLDETALWRHPLSRRSGQLAALVVRRGWHEGRTPRTVAGAVLSICLDGLYPGHRTQRRQQQQQQREQQKRRRRSQGRAGRRPGGGVRGEGGELEMEQEHEGEGEEEAEGAGPLTIAALARHALCAPRQLIALKQELLGHLLQLCAGMPLAPGLVTAHNVAGQLELLVAAEEALAGAAAAAAAAGAAGSGVGAGEAV